MENCKNSGRRKRIVSFSSQDNQVILSNKGRGLYNKALILLKDAEKEIPPLSRKGYLPYRDTYRKLCRAFSMPSNEILEVLSFLREMGLIDFVKFKGVKLNYTLK